MSSMPLRAKAPLTTARKAGGAMGKPSVPVAPDHAPQTSSSAPPHLDRFHLTEEQEDAQHVMRHVRAAFLTGEAGTGKSTVIREFMRHAEDTVVAAPTGIAALNIEGCTLHRLCQLPFGAMSPQILKDKPLMGRAKRTLSRLRRLVIDEISMVRADVLQAVDTRLREAQDPWKPFGGVQVIFVGDFGQLPPVVVASERRYFEDAFGGPFAFNAPIWSEADVKLVRLTTSLRQHDAAFIEALNAIRAGDPDGLDLINTRAGLAPPDNAVILCSRNRQVDTINARRLASLTGEQRIYHAAIQGEFSEKDCPVPTELQLKEGARVMLLANCYAEGSEHLNGEAGQVVELADRHVMVQLDRGDEVKVVEHTWEVFDYEYDEAARTLKKWVRGSFTALPLRIFYACTIHKAQGATLSQAVINLGGAFAGGQLYVALSRIRSLDGLYLAERIENEDVITDSRVLPWL